MKQNKLTLLTPAGLVLASMLGFFSTARAEVVDGNKGELVTRNGKAATKSLNPGFDADLYQQLRVAKGNVFFSPYGISEAMGMAYGGAAGKTAKEIAGVLHFDGPQETLGNRMQLLRQLVTTRTTNKDNKLNIANALCVTGFGPGEPYQKNIRQFFEAEVFSGGLKEINGWVSRKTEGNIDKILEELNPNSACVLLNAVYFKGKWKHSFQESMTREGKFHVTTDQSVTVGLMHRKGKYVVARGEGWLAVEVPYETSASMILIQPTKGEGMAALEEKLSQAMLRDVHEKLTVASAKPEEIELVMPKFKLATSYDLIEPFKKMGMNDAFDMNKANFSGMYTDNSVYITQIKYRASLEVDEKGAVASAATAIEMSFKSAPRPVAEIRFDRPFLALIQERETQSTIFIGRISDPTK